MTCKVPTFTIRFKYNWKYYNLKVEQIYVDERTEQFKIGSERKHMIIQTNRPFFRNRGLKKRNPNITQITQGAYQGNHLEELIKTIIEKADSYLPT